jgi:hypothetical protein
MACLICKDLERTLDFRRSKYFEARSAAYFQVSTKLAAQKNVDMERAKSDLEEHQLACASAAKARQSLSKSPEAALDSGR